MEGIKEYALQVGYPSQNRPFVPDSAGLKLLIGQVLPLAIRYPVPNASFLYKKIGHSREIGRFAVPIIGF